MMKFVLALVLLHFCSSYNVNRDLNNEMITNLDKLNQLCKGNNVNITSPVVHIPKMNKSTHPSSCVNVFATTLKRLLDNVTVPKQNETILVELKANLQALFQPVNQSKIPPKCPMVRKNTRLLGIYPFQSYINFLMTLNKRKR